MYNYVYVYVNIKGYALFPACSSWSNASLGLQSAMAKITLIVDLEQTNEHLHYFG